MSIFRAIMFILVLGFSFLATYAIEKLIIPLLSSRAKQPIYSDGPAWHQSKSGTPTMGGIAFVVAVTACLLVSSLSLYLSGERNDSVSLLVAVIFCFFNSVIGMIDDMTKIRRKQNAGLTPMQKIVLQTIFAVIFIFSRQVYLGDDTYITLPFAEFDAGLFYYPFALIIILGIVNCANLTDGIDGLAGCVAFALSSVFFFVSAQSSISTALIALSSMGGILGFLIFNINPAKIFMGDTGSLFLGAVAVSLAFSFNAVTFIIPAGIVYVLEGISVIAQVAFFKLTKKRIFKMAPVHHHLEKSGWSENKICVVAVITTIISSVLFCGMLKII